MGSRSASLLAWGTASLLAFAVSSAGARKADAQPTVELEQTWGATRDVRAAVVVGDEAWLATWGGLVRVGREGRTHTWTAMEGLPTTRVRAIARGPEGALVLAMEGEIVWWRGGHVLRRTPSRLPSSLAVSTEGTVFVSALDGVRAIPPIGGGAAPTRLIDLPPRSTVYSLAWHQGALWIGTMRGLYRDDGASARRVPGRLADPAVIALASSGPRLYVATPGGISIVEGERITRRTFGRGMVDVRALALDAEGGLVVGTGGLGVFHVDRRGRTTAMPELSRSAEARVIARFGDRWLIGRADGASWGEVELALPGIPAGDLSALARTPDRLWVGTFDRGLIAIANDGAQRTWTEASGLLDDRVNALLAHHDGSVFVALERGVCQVGRGVRCWRGGQGPARGHAMALAVLDDAVLAGSSGGLARYHAGTWRQIPLPFARVTSIVPHPRGGAWVGTAEGLLRLGADMSVLETRTASSRGLHDDWVTALLVDGERLWVGTYSSGLASIEADGALRVVDSTSWINPNAGARVDGAVWFGALDGGVVRVHDAPGGASPRRWDAPLPSMDVTAILADGADVWIATRAGLARGRRAGAASR